MVAERVVYECSECGAATEWDDGTEGPVLCCPCYDSKVEAEVNALRYGGKQAMGRAIVTARKRRRDAEIAAAYRPGSGPYPGNAADLAAQYGVSTRTVFKAVERQRQRAAAHASA